jgi:hypothetical protein
MVWCISICLICFNFLIIIIAHRTKKNIIYILIHLFKFGPSNLKNSQWFDTCNFLIVKIWRMRIFIALNLGANYRLQATTLLFYVMWQNSVRTCDITFKSLCLTIIAVEKEKVLNVLIVYMLPYLSSMQSACTTLYFHLRPVRLHSIFTRYIINGMIFGKMYLIYNVYIDFLYNFSEIFFILWRIKWYYHK